MKISRLILICVLCLFIFAACGTNAGDKGPATADKENSQNIAESNAAENKAENQDNEDTELSVSDNTDINTAVVYFSATGNTRTIAEMLAKELDAELFEIEPEELYTKEDLSYNNDSCRANIEQNDSSARPEISSDLSETEIYDVIYLGYPIWWGTTPRIIQTYLENYDLSDSRIYTFCTSGSSGIERSISNLKEFYPELDIAGGKRLNNSSAETISEWIEDNNKSY